MRQSKKGALTETIINVTIGYTINIGAQYLIFPLFGIQVSLQDNLMIGACFTVIAIARGYVIRRWFDNRIHRWATK